MKARKSQLAERLLADPAARDKFRDFMAHRKLALSKGEKVGAEDTIAVPTQTGRVLVVPRLLSTKVAG